MFLKQKEIDIDTLLTLELEIDKDELFEVVLSDMRIHTNLFNPISNRGGGWFSPPIRIIEMTSWNNDAESLIITYFSYFGLTNISQLVLSVFVQ